jgi:L-fucose isomerase-like protein
MDQGKLGICENDPTSGVTMWLLYHASGEAVFLGDIGRMNRTDGTISLCHCGVASTQLAENVESVRIKRYVLDPDGGLCIEFPLKKGPVTLAKLMRPQDGRFSMFLARGESVKGPEQRGSVVYVKPEGCVDLFLSKMLEEGVEHHITLGYGDMVGPLVRWCSLMDIRVILP